jgi:hypothetical protein
MTSPKTYNLQITEKQAQALLYATDLLQRIELGQWEEIIDWMPLKKPIDYGQLHEDKRTIGTILAKHLVDDAVSVYGCSLGIGHPDLPKNNGVLYDLHCVIRRKLAIERAVEEGTIENENVSRSKMPITVDFDYPMRWGDEPLAKMERV